MWFFYALAFALLSSLTVVVAKKIMQNVNEYGYLLFNSLFTFPFLLSISLVLFPFPKVDRTFVIAVVVGTVISVTAAILAYRAIKSSEVSLVNPISAFNPVFTAVIAFLFLGEKISPQEMLGIGAIVVGAYLLQLSKTKKGLVAPVKALFSHRGIQLSFVAYFLWAITPTFEKTAILHTVPQNPPMAALAGQVVAIIIYLPLVARFSQNTFVGVKRTWKWFLLNGVIGGVGIALAFKAMSLGNLGPTTAVFKLSMIFTVILGWLFFKEKNIRERLLGSLVMLIGVLLLVL